MRTIKGASARAIQQHLGQHGAVWQEESFDHVLRASENLDAKCDYILQNPVRAGRDLRLAHLSLALAPIGTESLRPASKGPPERTPNHVAPGRIRRGNASPIWRRADECVRRHVLLGDNLSRAASSELMYETQRTFVHGEET